MRSVRRYLLSRVLIGAAVVLGLAGALVYAAVARSLERQFDSNLADRVQAHIAGAAALARRLGLE